MKRVSYQNLRRLAYFQAIAQAGSIRGAARRLGLSVPVLSSAMSELEEELGVSLAVRSTRRLALTSTGQVVFNKASTMLDAAQDALAVSGGDRQLTGRVSATLPVELALHWLPKHLARIRETHPAIRIDITADDHVVDLNASKYDVAVRTVYWPKRPVQTGFEKRASGWLDLVLIAKDPPPLYPVDNNQNLKADAAFLVGPGGSDWFAAYGPDTAEPIKLRASNVISVANREVAIAFARQGLGCALVTELSVRQDLESGKLVQILPDMSFGGISWHLMMRDKLPSPEALAFAEALSGADKG